MEPKATSDLRPSAQRLLARALSAACARHLLLVQITAEVGCWLGDDGACRLIMLGMDKSVAALAQDGGPLMR